MRKGLIAVLALVAALPACTGGVRRPAAGGAPVIRALIGERESVRVEVTGAFDVETGGLVLMRSPGAAAAEVTRSGDALQVRIDPAGSSGVGDLDITIDPAAGAEVRVAGVAYDGRIVVRPGEGSRLMVINVLPLESYLEGVVPHEIGNPGPDAFAALEAQSITARTYALSRIRQRREEPFDVFAGVRDQVYRGKSGTMRTTTAAVRDTRGLVLEDGGHLCRTYYSATCGGHTSDIRRVWPQREDAPYLHGSYDRTPREDESFCSWTRRFRWRYTFSGRDMGRILRKTLPLELGVPSVGSFVDLRVEERTPSGRVRRLAVVTTEGTFFVEGDRIRWVLMTDVDNSRILPSTMFDVEETMQEGRAAVVSLVGGGNGHGVGMCQNGAIGMARKGYSYRMILAHYYPGTTLARRY